MAVGREEIFSTLKGSPLFCALTDEELQALISIALQVETGPDEDLFLEEQRTDGLYIVLSGRFRLKEYENGERKMRLLQRGDVAGFEPLLNIPERECTVSSVARGSLLFLTNGQVNKYLNSSEDFCRTKTVFFNSQEMIRRIPMPWLDKGEGLSLMTRRHPMVLFRRLVVPMFVLLCALLLTAIVLENLPHVALIVLLSVFLVCSAWLVWTVNNWMNDYYLITSRRVVWVEHVTLWYDKRLEIPIKTIISVGVTRKLEDKMLGYADVTVRTLSGKLTMEHVGNADIIAKMVQSYWKRSQQIDLDDDSEAVRKVLREKLGKSNELSEMKALPEEVEEEQARSEPHFFRWLIGNFFRLRFEDGHSVIYRRHWVILLKHGLWAAIGFLISFSFLVAVLTHNVTKLNYPLALSLSLGMTITFLLVFIYQTVDWHNDIFMITPENLVDIDRKPFAKENKLTAPLDRVVSVTCEREGITAILFNVGTVTISVAGDQLRFEDVYRPSEVEQEILSFMQKNTERTEKRLLLEERERVARWFKVYHEEITANLDETEENELTRSRNRALPPPD